MQNCSFSGRDHVWLVEWFTKITSLNEYTSCMALLPSVGQKLWAMHGYPRKGKLISTVWIQPQVPVPAFRQWHPVAGTQANANIATPFVPGMPNSVQLSTTHNIRESKSTRKPLRAQVPSPMPVSFSCSSPRSCKWCCSWQIWPMELQVFLLWPGPWEPCSLWIYETNTSCVCCLLLKEHLLPGILSQSPTAEVQTHDNIREEGAFICKRRRNRAYWGLEGRKEAKGWDVGERMVKMPKDSGTVSLNLLKLQEPMLFFRSCLAWSVSAPSCKCRHFASIWIVILLLSSGRLSHITSWLLHWLW